MSPYRHPADPVVPRDDRAPRGDDVVLGSLLAAIGGMRVVIAVATDETWGAEASIAAILLALGVVLVLARR
jgi:hypothetical protein